MIDAVVAGVAGALRVIVTGYSAWLVLHGALWTGLWIGDRLVP